MVSSTQDDPLRREFQRMSDPREKRIRPQYFVLFLFCSAVLDLDPTLGTDLFHIGRKTSPFFPLRRFVVHSKMDH